MKKHILILLALALGGCASMMPVSKEAYDFKSMDRKTRRIVIRTERFLKSFQTPEIPAYIGQQSRVDSVLLDEETQSMKIYLNQYFSYFPYRPERVTMIYDALKDDLGWWYRKWNVTLYTLETPISELVPNVYRDSTETDPARRGTMVDRPEPLVRNLSKQVNPDSGLSGNAIALWHSHGWYYNLKKDRWEWERPRLFETVEDKLPLSFMIPYIIPMLENAGGTVFVARERDTQVHEVIVDNDSSDSLSYREKGDWGNSEIPGFAIGNPPYEHNVNPFRLGTIRRTEADSVATAQIRWIPDIPEAGRYAVYVSYEHHPGNVTDARYTVYHKGGKTEFAVNQTIGGRTWIFLDYFEFDAGQNPEKGSIVLTNETESRGRMITADAVKFGGGMGDVARNGRLSGRPRWLEASRYYLQFAGMPDTLVYDFHDDTLDYNDDYKSRGEWANYLKGAPYGPNVNRDAPGLGIPVDLSFAFHTDAGIRKDGRSVGTLSIYSMFDEENNREFPDGQSRLASRDYADILQTQIVNDIRAKYDPFWTRRQLMQGMYSEAYRPNMPAGLLELLSHQNFYDMKFTWDPRFRFDISRSIYKAMLKFIADQYDRPYVVQPLPVDHFTMESPEKGTLVLKWKPVSDPLEPTAEPKSYRVYIREEGKAFDNGRPVEDTSFIVTGLEMDKIYSFKVTAVNTGGESFPSEILSAGFSSRSDTTVWVINGFDRVSGPATVETNIFEGFAGFMDMGVADGKDYLFTGRQTDWAPSSPFLTNDAPGHGASMAYHEQKVTPGNTHNFPEVYGQSILQAGYSFLSTSDEAIVKFPDKLKDVPAVILILGEEKSTPGPSPGMKPAFQTFDPELQSLITDYLTGGGKMFISGSYVGTDLFKNGKSKADSLFAMDVLKFTLASSYAEWGGKAISFEDAFLKDGTTLSFNTRYHPEIYQAEAVDAIDPVDSLATTILRYGDNYYSAAVAYDGDYRHVVMGFPFETILEEADRNTLMDAVLKFLFK
ncbi:fibronectin type III domain-containing protein [Fidelibacter multiformis]|uniref:golvesin C-terminal-like domain-containing protein n=1 Tax=Fidelibacter multiformis TaxID=3377529 RepID=UPI0037DDD733